MTTYIEVKYFRVDDVVIDNLDVQASRLFGDVLQELVDLGPTNAIGAVNKELA